MALVRSTIYAPDIYKALNGILLIYKPPRMSSKELVAELRNRISDELNQYQPRPISKHLSIEGEINEEKQIVEVPNLADHPLVVGPRYTPWELSISVINPRVCYRSSGLELILLGDANRYYLRKMNRARMVSIYHISGKFGYITDNFFYDGKIQDKTTYKYIRTGKIDATLARIQSGQHERLFDSSKVPIDSEEAYEMAKAWPSRPPRMARWPVIYRIRCIHFKLPDFKIEVTVINETEDFLAQLPHDIGIMLKSGAHTTSIRRVKFGPFDVDNSLTSKDWDLQSLVNHLHMNNQRRHEIHSILDEHSSAMPIRTEYNRGPRDEAFEDST